MGMRHDMMQCISLARIDDVKRRSRVGAACEAIYSENNTIDSTAVENLLKEEYLVLTAVGGFLYDAM